MLQIPFSNFIAILVFVSSWGLYSWLAYRSPWSKNTLSHAMDTHRYRWMRAMLKREVRIADTNIASGLQQGTAFFASASLLAIGGTVTLLSAMDEVTALARTLDLPFLDDPIQNEAKTFGLMIILAYAFFKFGWAYRLFNYTTIVMGSIPDDCHEDNEEAVEASLRAARLATLAGRHFSSGQQALFFAVGYLGWYAGPFVFIGTTLMVTLVLLRRQFFSKARKAVLPGPNTQDLVNSGA
ncbi:hypothetical protein PsAD46_04330 [Pseudovibrio sp. Ad46]|uniref:DUF599 domain-containing protein n=1 Tax=unclassified Pseudovibrio TaxID=2627060 RepID=UPI0007AED4FF|nr:MULTISPECIES: DUF599 family protein [unclassified Pseudovibrio]KZK79618.1 hypothetical protein PsAD46_04330 [Pseudovibrio sp. Ad46]KZK98308.1 hypothetical protein PsAD5_01678 [Pseudovibrio sp. Ad5]